MRDVLIVFFILNLLLMIIFFPFKTRFMAHVNFLNQKCYYCAKVGFVKLLCGKIVIENSKIKMTNDNTILTQNYNNLFVKNVMKETMSRIDVKKLEIFFTGGFEENSFSSAIMCGLVTSFVNTLYGYLSLKFDSIKMYEDIKPTFEDDNLELTTDIVVSISLFKMIVSVLKADKKTKKLKEIENER